MYYFLSYSMCTVVHATSFHHICKPLVAVLHSMYMHITKLAKHG